MTRPYELRRRGGLPALEWSAFDGHPVDAFVTTRHGGLSAGRYESLNLGFHVGDEEGLVLANRRRVAVALGAELDDFVFCGQAHGGNVRIVAPEHRGSGARDPSSAIAATDALVTAEPGIALAIIVADCVPVVLFDPKAHVLACAHAGWRGTVQGVAAAALTAMCSLGARPADVIAGIGPAIPPDRYQVGEEVVEAVRETFGDLTGIAWPDGRGRWLLDLWAANRRQLGASGVPDEQIHIADLPTGPGTDYFSHRAGRPCGRMAAVARLNAPRPNARRAP